MDGAMSDFSRSPLEVNTKFGSYSVRFAPCQELDFDDDSILICDSNPIVLEKVKHLKTERQILVDAVEERKSGSTGLALIEQLADLRATKKTSIYAFGGGLVQDLATFSTSLYMRGLSWNYLPTTLMSAMDSCIGGKSSINLGNYKNLIGNFHPPRSVMIDISFINTLNEIEKSSGIAEGAKICFAKGAPVFDKFQTKLAEWRKLGDQDSLEAATEISLKAKKWFIEIDEFDERERRLLNFGHSFGHALEASTEFAVPHGIGVLLGMKAAVFESGNESACSGLLSFIDKEIEYSLFRENKITLSQATFREALSRDKKNSRTDQVLILPNIDGLLEATARPLNRYNIESCLDAIKRSLSESGMNFEVL